MKSLITGVLVGLITSAIPVMAASSSNPKNSSRLTVQQAAEMVLKTVHNNESYLRLNWLTSIDRDVARALAQLGQLAILKNNNSSYLELNGLKSIEKDVAQELSRFQGYELSLDGLTSIDKEVAKGLAKFHGKKLSLNGLASIDRETVKELARFKGDWLVLGFTSLDPEDAREFAKGKGNGLSFDRLTSMKKEVAHELSRFMGYRLTLDGLTSISKEVAQELAKLRPRPNNWGKFLKLDGLTSISKGEAHELAKFSGQLALSGLKSMNSEVAREFAQFKGISLDIVYLKSIAPDDLNILKDGLRKPGTQNSYRAMMPWKLNDGTYPKKWSGKVMEFRKDGSKARLTDYKYGGVTLRIEWDEVGNLTKKETYPVHKPAGVDMHSLEAGDEKKDTWENEVKRIEALQGFSIPAIPNFSRPEREIPRDFLKHSEKLFKGIAYVKGEKEPFTGVGVSVFMGRTKYEYTYLNGKLHGRSVCYYSDGSTNWEALYIKGKRVFSSTYRLNGSKYRQTGYVNGNAMWQIRWDKDGNLIEKETYDPDLVTDTDGLY